MKCPICEEYDVDYPPVGGNRIPLDDGSGVEVMCEHCNEYSIEVIKDKENTKE